MDSRTSAIESGLPTFVSIRSVIRASVTGRLSWSIWMEATGSPMSVAISWAEAEEGGGQRAKGKVHSKYTVRRDTGTSALPLTFDV